MSCSPELQQQHPGLPRDEMASEPLTLAQQRSRDHVTESRTVTDCAPDRSPSGRCNLWHNALISHRKLRLAHYGGNSWRLRLRPCEWPARSTEEQTADRFGGNPGVQRGADDRLGGPPREAIRRRG